MDRWLIGLLAICAVLVALPPKYDPAVRLKELIEKKRRERDS